MSKIIASSTLSAPNPTEPDSSWEHIDLWHAVKKAIYTLPSNFQSDLQIAGVLATDLFAFNSSLGATIEVQVVASLNKLRAIWDPNDKYALYSFERQPQTFPDVVLKASAPSVKPEVLMGIELKGWYVLAKEREPSFRYKVTPAVCASADLLVVVPWSLSKVISGSPEVFKPFVVGAKYAAEYRNWWWEFERGSSGDSSIVLSKVREHYPNKSSKISDHPAKDDGGNYGRFARTGLMEAYINKLFDEPLSGIPLQAWQRFLSLFTEGQTSESISKGLDKIASSLSDNEKENMSSDEWDMIKKNVAEIG